MPGYGTKNTMLAVDTSTRTTGIAIYDGTQVLSEKIWLSNTYHTVELAPAVDEMVRSCCGEVNNLGALAVALGPGSFTGLRIGLAFVKGLALVHRLPVIGIPSLDVLAASQNHLVPEFSDSMVMAAVLRAGRGRLAVGWYQIATDFNGDRHWKPEQIIESLSATELSDRIQAPTIICGELTEEERRQAGRKWKKAILASPAACLRRPSYLAELAWRRWQADDFDNPGTLAPIYLHPNSAEAERHQIDDAAKPQPDAGD